MQANRRYNCSHQRLSLSLPLSLLLLSDPLPLLDRLCNFFCFLCFLCLLLDSLCRLLCLLDFFLCRLWLLLLPPASAAAAAAGSMPADRSSSCTHSSSSTQGWQQFSTCTRTV
jgi:hypothetical protein